MVKEELERNLNLLKKNIESPIFQCNIQMAMLSRSATRANYEAFINNEISREQLLENNNTIGLITRNFTEMCSCIREKF